MKYTKHDTGRNTNPSYSEKVMLDMSNTLLEITLLYAQNKQ